MTMRQSRRWWGPGLVAVGIWAAAWATYNLSPGLPRAIHQPLAAVAGAAMFAMVHLSALAVWPMSRARGASVGAAFAASFATPLAWALKEVVRLTASFTVAESLFYLLSPLVLAAFLAATAGMGAGELADRARRRRSGQPIATVGGVPLAVALGSLLLIAALFGRTMGEQAVYTFLDAYRVLFGPGVGLGAAWLGGLDAHP